MRVAYLSHSLVADRQRIFAAELRRQLEADGGALMEIYPTTWGRHVRTGGIDAQNAGDMANWMVPEPETWMALDAFEPDVVLLQQEPYCRVSGGARLVCAAKGYPYVIFSWENATPHGEQAASVLADAAARVYGNHDALVLGERAVGHARKSYVLPQVGVEPYWFPFCPDSGDRVLFAGRPDDPMKGLDFLRGAAKGQPWEAQLRVLGDEPYASYSDMASRFWSARFQIVSSLDVPGRPREQFAPYAAIEGLFCGVPVVATTQNAVKEWLDGCPAVVFATMGSVSAFRTAARMMNHEMAKAPMSFDAGRRAGSEWARARFSNEVVAKQWVAVLKEACA